MPNSTLFCPTGQERALAKRRARLQREQDALHQQRCAIGMHCRHKHTWLTPCLDRDSPIALSASLSVYACQIDTRRHEHTLRHTGIQTHRHARSHTRKCTHVHAHASTHAYLSLSRPSTLRRNNISCCLMTCAILLSCYLRDGFPHPRRSSCGKIDRPGASFATRRCCLFGRHLLAHAGTVPGVRANSTRFPGPATVPNWFWLATLHNV